MMMIFTEEEKYISFKDWTCVRAATPPEIVKSLKEASEYHSRMVGGAPLIRFI